MWGTEKEGQIKIEILIKNQDNEIFNDWESNFISDLVRKRYSHLTAREKQIVNRLMSWLVGGSKSLGEGGNTNGKESIFKEETKKR